MRGANSGTASSRRIIGAVVALAVTLSTTAVRAADDAGIGAFFRQQFGIGEPAPAPAPTYQNPFDHPLVVRRHRRPSVARQSVAKVVVGPTGPVSIYDDTTLRTGDAVMTRKGLRVFVGSHSAPYTDEDFVAVSDVDGMPKGLEKALVAIEKAPHG